MTVYVSDEILEKAQKKLANNLRIRTCIDAMICPSCGEELKEKEISNEFGLSEFVNYCELCKFVWKREHYT